MSDVHSENSGLDHSAGVGKMVRLGRKQRIKNADWIEAFGNIEQMVSRKELDQLVDKTVKEIKKKTNGKKAAYAWSGGKDSLVLGDICKLVGIKSEAKRS